MVHCGLRGQTGWLPACVLHRSVGGIYRAGGDIRVVLRWRRECGRQDQRGRLAIPCLTKTGSCAAAFGTWSARRVARWIAATALRARMALASVCTSVMLWARVAHGTGAEGRWRMRGAHAGAGGREERRRRSGACAIARGCRCVFTGERGDLTGNLSRFFADPPFSLRMAMVRGVSLSELPDDGRALRLCWSSTRSSRSPSSLEGSRDAAIFR
jgi:hypothetical protein